MIKKILFGILLSVLFLFGLLDTSDAQAINSATMTLIDHDGNGFANIGDEVEVSVIVDGTISGTSVRIFNNDLFEGAGPFTLNKETAGFGDGIEYAITLPIGSGATHDGADPLNVEFLIQTRLEGSTTDDLTDVTISGVSETIDNVPPAVSNSVFDDLGAGVLVTGADFEISIDAADGSGIASVTADLRRLGLSENVTVPFDAGETYLLDSEQIQEAQNQDQVSLNQSRSIVFTVTDEAGNMVTYDSAGDGQSRNVDNVTPSAPVVVAVQRATDFNNTKDLFDIVITNGENPLDENNNPLLDELGNVITFSSLMSGGQYDLYWNGGDGSSADDLITPFTYNDNGVLAEHDTPFSEIAEDDFLLFRAVPVKISGLQGDDDEDSVVVQRGIVEAEITTPEDGFLVGNTPSTLFDVHAQVVAGLDGYELLDFHTRVYVRDVANPGIIETIGMIPLPDGTMEPDFVASANDFAGVPFSDEFDAVVRPRFSINDVQLRTLTPAVVFQNNPVRTYNVDYQNPTVTLVSVNGEVGIGSFFDIEAEGETDFIHTITDNFEMDHDVASITARFMDDGTGSEIIVIGPHTIAGHVNDGFLSVDNDEFTFTYDVFTLPALVGNPVFQIRVDDGRGNQTAYTGSAEFTLGDLPPPDPIVLLSPADEAENVVLQPLFEWDAADYVNTYELIVAENSNFSDPVIDLNELTETEYQTTVDLKPATTYYWQVRGINAGGEGDWSESFSFTTIPERPELVVLLNPANEAGDIILQPLFEWDAADGAESYELIVSESNDFSDPVIDLNELTETEYQTTVDLKPATTYYWQVRGINTGGEGDWSESFSFTTTGLPEAGDQRLLISNATPYTFSGVNFGLSETGYSVRIIDLPSNGVLEYKGNTVTANDVITVDDINNDDLTWTPPTGQHGYGFTFFEFSVIDDNDLESESTYVITLDLAATSVDLIAGKGWRFLTSPSQGDTFGDILEPLQIQGPAGSDVPGSENPNLFTLNQAEYRWDMVDAMNTEIEPGTGFIIFAFDDDTPATLTFGQNWQSLGQVFEFENLFYDPEQGDGGDSHFLIANPHPVSLDFCEFSKTDISSSIDMWNPSANNQNGDYINLNCAAGEVHIAPFQAFWIRTTAENPSLSIPEEAYLSSREDGYFKDVEESSDRPEGFIVSLDLQSEDGLFKNTVNVMFSRQGTEGMDPFDGLKLSPAGLAERWLSFYALDKDQKKYAFRSLPDELIQQVLLDKVNQVSIPIGIATTEQGSYILNWNLPTTEDYSGRYYLRDTQTGTVTEMRDGQNYRFNIDTDQTSKIIEQRSERFQNSVLFSESPRFELIFTSGENLYGIDEMPGEITLHQNYPNPFNPTTVISYELPENSHVRLEVYDMLGKQIATLVDGQVSAGTHQVNFDASNLSSGVYIYRLQAGGTMITKQLTLIK